MLDFIHNDPEFQQILSIVASNKSIDITLVEKDYWIMHTLYSLHHQGIEFELKGGTSLSKGYGIINRFCLSFKHNYRLCRYFTSDFGKIYFFATVLIGSFVRRI